MFKNRFFSRILADKKILKSKIPVQSSAVLLFSHLWFFFLKGLREGVFNNVEAFFWKGVFEGIKADDGSAGFEFYIFDDEGFDRFVVEGFYDDG